jgi:hypothetical protein
MVHSRITRRRQIRALVVLLAVAAIGGLAALAVLPLNPVRSAESPDGAFVAVAKISFIASLIPMMPGQSGDHPGRITIYRKDGRSCGSAPVGMVWMIQDLRWALAHRPREVSLVAGARWDLDACLVSDTGE